MKDFEEKRKILVIQERYEKGLIKEEELLPEVKEKLIALYKEQINTIKTNIDIHKNNLKYYKDEILKMKNKS